MKTVIDKANTRGYFNHGWLKPYHTFSFADYYNPRRIHFGALRVLNDDTVAPGAVSYTHLDVYKRQVYGQPPCRNAKI